MGLYARFVLPRLIDRVMQDPEVAKLRAAWIPRARGDVLEIGIGSGLNLPFYSSRVARVVGIDPSRELLERTRRRSSGLAFRVDLLQQPAEDPLPVPDRGLDTVVVTWSLCSIADPLRALTRAARALKPEGRLIFLEHGRSPDRSVAAWQDRLTPIWRRIGGGCHMNRAIGALVASAGFAIAELETSYLPGPRPMTYTYAGTATVAAA